MRRPRKITYRDPRDDGALCDQCPLNEQTPVFATTPKHPKLIVVGQNPGGDEVEVGENFVGRAGKRLDKSLAKFEIPRSALHLTNARLCPAPYGTKAKDLKLALECCRPRLSNELNALPKRMDHILALGAAAMNAVTNKKNITNRMGGPMPGADITFKQTTDKKTGKLKGNGPEFNGNFSRFTVVPTVQPALVLRAAHMGVPMTIHIGRAWGLQTGAIKPWKWPDFELWPGPSMVKALKRILRSKRYVAVDLETGGTEFKYAPVRVVGLSNGLDTVSIPWEAYNSKRHGTAKGLDSYPEGEEIADLTEKILNRKRLVGQNFVYDLLMMKHQMGIDVASNYWFDTLSAHRVIAPRLPHRLGFIATMEFHCPNWKTEFGDATERKGLEKYFERPEVELRIYNAKDAYMTALLVPPLMKRLGVTEREIDMLWRRTA